MLIETWSHYWTRNYKKPYVTSHLNQIVRSPVMLMFKLRLKSNIFIASNTEHSSPLILNLNDTTYRIHFLHLWTMRQLNLSSLFLIWEYLKWHLLLCHSTWEKKGSLVAMHCFILGEFSLSPSCLGYNHGGVSVSWSLLLFVLSWLFHKNTFIFLGPSLWHFFIS